MMEKDEEKNRLEWVDEEDQHVKDRELHWE